MPETGLSRSPRCTGVTTRSVRQSAAPYDVTVGILIRDGISKDFEPLCRIYEEITGQREVAEALVELYIDHYFVKLVEADEGIIGHLIWFPREEPRLGWAEILDIGIREDHRRKGLGCKVLREAICDIKRHFRSRGCSARCIMLFTSERNEPARRLYEKAGFRMVGYGGYVSEDGAKELLYALNFGLAATPSKQAP